jgi:outer membrane receptor protein involved in Fe transport
MRLRWEPSDAWFLDVGAFASRQSLNDNLFQLTHVGPNMLALMRTYDPEAEADGNNFHNSANVVARGIVTFKGANATYEHAADGLLGIDSLRFTSVTAYAKTVTQRRDFDADFSPVPVIVDTLAEPSPYRQISEELRFAGTHHSLFGLGGTFKFVIGGYYFDSHLASSDNFQLQDLGATVAYLAAARADGGANAQLPLYGGVLGNGGTLTELIDAIEPLLGPAIGQEQSALVKLTQHTSTNAAFGQAEWRVWRDVWFIGGVRVGHENKKGRASSQTDSRIIPLIAGQNNHDTPLHRSEREVSPKAGLKWQPNEAFSSYVTWSQGFKSGGFNALPLNDQNLEFDPEQATNVEGGIKGRFLGGSLSVTAAIYSTDFEDLQVSTFRGGNFIILNAARARSRGAEFDVRWLPPVNGTALIASMGLIRAHYTSYPNAPAPADSTDNPPVQDLTGERLAITPRYSASLIPSYSMTTPFQRKAQRKSWLGLCGWLRSRPIPGFPLRLSFDLRVLCDNGFQSRYRNVSSSSHRT